MTNRPEHSVFSRLRTFAKIIAAAVFICLGFTSVTFAGESNQQFHIESFAQYRDLNQKGLMPRQEQYEGFVLTDYSYSWTGEALFFEIKPQLRGVESPSSNIAPGRRWLGTRRTVVAESDKQLFFDFDRLNLRYQWSNFEMYAGRRPMSLGVLRLFPVWNKLTLPLIFEPGPEWIDNPDGLGIRGSVGPLDIRFINLQGENPREDAIRMAEFKFAPASVELHFLLADWWQRTAFGAAMATDLWDATWRLEAIRFSEKDSDPTLNPTITQWGAGVERALGTRFTVSAEYLQQSLCRDLHSGYGVTTLSRFQVLNGCRYFFPYLDFQVNSAWKTGAGVLANLSDPSFFAIYNLEYIWTDNLSILLKAKWAFGSERREFGSKRYQDVLGNEAGAQSTIFAGLSYTI
jgi:hypothetical protein